MYKNNFQKISSALTLSFLLFFNGCGTTNVTGDNPNNILPIADAGEDIVVIQNELFTFDASRSYDLDGNITNYEWFCPGFNISLYSGPNSSLTMPAGRPIGDYNTTLIVTDDKNTTTEDYVIVKIIAPIFIAEAGENFQVLQDNFFTLDANKSFYKEGNIVSYEWLYTDNNLSLYKGSENITPDIQAIRAVGNYDIKLIVTNDKNETAEDIVTIYIDEDNSGNQFVDIFSLEINISQFKELQQQNTVYIDIRGSSEWKSTGIIEGSYTNTILASNINNIWLQEGSEFLTWVTDKDQSFTIICYSGAGRARSVAEELERNGYTNVHWLSGGIGMWITAEENLVPVSESIN